jgi:hypothetical protein
MQHIDLNDNHWFKLSVEEQLANIGSEIERAMKWKKKGNLEYSNLANVRALELIDLTLQDTKYGRGVNEITKLREIWLDYFLGDNQYSQTEVQWKKYFNAFTYAARNNATFKSQAKTS